MLNCIYCEYILSEKETNRGWVGNVSTFIDCLFRTHDRSCRAQPSTCFMKWATAVCGSRAGRQGVRSVNLCAPKFFEPSLARVNLCDPPWKAQALPEGSRTPATRHQPWSPLKHVQTFNGLERGQKMTPRNICHVL